MTTDLPQERYVAALKRIREQIANGLPLSAYDDTTPGNKSTHCAWGLCSMNKEQWPDAQDHLWPDDFIKRGRVAPKYRRNGQHCPMDTDQDKATNAWGCFHRCRMFRANKRNPVPTREEALQLYDLTIATHATNK